mmetsp:Transcript_16743/g.25488  ORF Transcript_16743/g.25488 Transcript_16743/m.25488 type:complete len:199 (-) Transcript_16743:12-608(-)
MKAAAHTYLLPLILFLFFPCVVVASNKFDEDKKGLNCKEVAEKDYCTKDPQTYFDCPATCAEHLRPQRPHWGGFERKESPFYEFNIKDVNGKTIRFEDFDGHVTVVALVPLYPGLAPFHRELLEHVFDIYKKTFVVSIVILPMKGQDGVTMGALKEGSKVKMLEGVGDEEHELVKYLSKKIQKGVFDASMLNSFIISP